MAKMCFRGQWGLPFALTAASLFVSSACAIGQEVQGENAGSPKVTGPSTRTNAGAVRKGLKPIQYYYLAEIAARNKDLRTLLACCQNLQEYMPQNEAQGYLSAVRETLAPRYPVDRACLELYEKAVLAEDSKSEKQALRNALIKKYPKFEYGYLLEITENPFIEHDSGTDYFIYQQVQDINPNNAFMLAALCAEAYQNYDEEHCKNLYFRLRKLNPYFKTFDLDSIDRAYERWQATTRQEFANEVGNGKSPFAKLRPKLIPLLDSTVKQINNDNIATSAPSIGRDAKGNLLQEKVKETAPGKQVKAPVAVQPTIAFIDKAGTVAFEPGPSVTLGNSYKDGMLVVNASEGRGINCNNGSTQYWNTKGELAIAGTFSDGKSSSEGLCAISRNGKWGFVNHKGKLIVACKYREVMPFSQGLAAVRNANGWGFINKSGVLVAEHMYSNCLPFSEGLAAVKLGDKIGYIDKNGILTIPAVFSQARSFSFGAAQVKSPQIEQLQSGGYIDKSGKPCVNMDALKRKYGSVRVSCSLFNPFGEDGQISSSDFCSMNFYGKSGGAEDFAQGLLPLRLGSKVGYIDTKGNVVIEPQFDEAGPFSDGIAKITVAGKSGYIDKSGKFIVSAKYRGAGQFCEGMAAVSEDGEHWGYINTKGTLVIPTNFAQAEKFCGGLARVGITPDKLRIVAHGKATESAGTANSMPSAKVKLSCKPISMNEYESRIADSIKKQWQCQEAISALNEQFTFRLTAKGLPYDLQIVRGMVDYAAIVSTIDAIVLAAPYQPPQKPAIAEQATIVCTVTGSSGSPQIAVTVIKQRESKAQAPNLSLTEAIKSVKYINNKPINDKIIRSWMLSNLIELCRMAAIHLDSPQLQAHLIAALEQIGLDSKNASNWLALGRAVTTNITITRNPDKANIQSVNTAIGAFSQAYQLTHNRLHGLELSRAWADNIALQILGHSQAEPLMLGTAAALNDNWSVAREQILAAQTKQPTEATALLERLNSKKDQTYLMPSIKTTPMMTPKGTSDDLAVLLRWLPVDTESVIANCGPYRKPSETPSDPMHPPKASLADTLRNFCSGPSCREANGKHEAANTEPKDPFDDLEYSAGIMAGRNFQRPNGLGCGTSSGATIVALSGKEFAQTRSLMSKLKAKANLCTTIEGVETLIFQSAGGSYEQGWIKYVFAPMDGVIVQASDRAYMLEMLERLKSAPTAQAFADKEFNIEDLRLGCQSWAVRKMQKCTAPFDYTSREYVSVGRASDEDDGFKIDPSAVGTVVSIKPGNVVNIKLIGGDSESLKSRAEGWKRLLTSDSTSAGYLFSPHLKQDAQTVQVIYKPGAIEIEQKCQDYQSAMFGLALLGSMGYVVFL